jgi:hypothetical protein
MAPTPRRDTRTVLRPSVVVASGYVVGSTPGAGSALSFASVIAITARVLGRWSIWAQ